jgi:hypothetical protein
MNLPIADSLGRTPERARRLTAGKDAFTTMNRYDISVPQKGALLNNAQILSKARLYPSL